MIEKTFLNSKVQLSAIQQLRESRTNGEVTKSNERQEELTATQAKELVVNMNHFLEIADTQLRFQFHEELNEYYVTIINSQTDEVVREIPPKRLMDIYAAMREFIGVLIDRKI